MGQWNSSKLSCIASVCRYYFCLKKSVGQWDPGHRGLARNMGTKSYTLTATRVGQWDYQKYRPCNKSILLSLIHI